MSCDEYRDMINAGEDSLSSSQQTKLIKHLEGCHNCKEYSLKVVESFKLISRISEVEPQLTYPDRLASDIMEQIQMDERKIDFRTILEHLLDRLFSFKMRVAIFSIVVVLVGLFAYQQYFIVTKLDRIETKIAKDTGDNSESSEFTPYVNQQILKEFASGSDQELISLDKNKLEQLINEYRDLKTDHDQLLKLLDDNLKELENGLSEGDLKKLKKLLNNEGLQKEKSVEL